MSDPVIEARQRVETAKAELATAEAEQKQQQVGQWIAELAAVRLEKAQARDRHRELQSRIHIEQDLRANAQAKVVAVLEQLRDSERARPVVADYLPDDPEVVQWLKAHKALEAKRDRLMAERDRLPDPDLTIIEANKYRGATGIIVQLEFAEQNLIRAIEGKPGVQRFEGGVFGVS
jgi:hypothetical protein